MDSMSIPAPPPLGDDDITHFRHVIAGGPGNDRQKLTVEVVSLVDNGLATPPILSVHGALDMHPDHADGLVDALRQAQAAHAAARKSWIDAL
ncbi:hypothetical protein G6027_06290 [Dietzia sp. SLG310A2-38A2]|uniref:hypothetical protein n=1 Tax=Dietzia sp. SLG310A2-38A2 TaxID=1630643 RepID=UPI0015F7C2F7|nr:hypothetical protein [Dietzia sp. SLG310A2-38A2]MBB1030496.1 hypothetical protein [Dietzia sp. SLG310A2-38A2]